jgi:outer membrane protein assembly factor BamD (BamD/ComL family)
VRDLQQIARDQEAQRAAQQAWDKIKDSSDQAALQTFVTQYPSSLLVLNAQKRLSDLQQVVKGQEAQQAAQQAWDKVKDSSDQTALQAFMKQYANSPLVLNAQKRLSDLQQITRDQDTQRAAQQAWDKIKDSSEQGALQAFIEQYPNSQLTLNAQKRVSELQQTAKDQEAQQAAKQAWDKIKDSSEQGALQAFMKQYPNSPLALNAQRRLSELQQAAKDQQSQQAEKKPPKTTKSTRKDEDVPSKSKVKNAPVRQQARQRDEARPQVHQEVSASPPHSGGGGGGGVIGVGF